LQKGEKPPQEGPMAKPRRKTFQALRRGRPVKRIVEIINPNNSSMTNDCQYSDFPFSPLYTLFILFILFLCQKKQNKKIL
jgi:hypothetical protein